MDQTPSVYCSNHSYCVMGTSVRMHFIFCTVMEDMLHVFMCGMVNVFIMEDMLG